MSLLTRPTCHSLAANMSLHSWPTCHCLHGQHVTPYAVNMSLLTRPTCHCLRGQHVTAEAINRRMTGRFLSSFCTFKMTDFHSIPFFQLIFLVKLVLLLNFSYILLSLCPFFFSSTGTGPIIFIGSLTWCCAKWKGISLKNLRISFFHNSYRERV
jgi:hypothetical protein